MTRIKTQSGSVYEIDHDTKMIRRIDGTSQPTKRFGHGWKPYQAINKIEVGQRLYVLWGIDAVPGGCWLMRASETSAITEIETTTETEVGVCA